MRTPETAQQNEKKTSFSVDFSLDLLHSIYRILTHTEREGERDLHFLPELYKLHKLGIPYAVAVYARASDFKNSGSFC